MFRISHYNTLIKVYIIFSFSTSSCAVAVPSKYTNAIRLFNGGTDWMGVVVANLVFASAHVKDYVTDGAGVNCLREVSEFLTSCRSKLLSCGAVPICCVGGGY